VPLFPPDAPVGVLIDGRPLTAYVRAYVSGGHVYAPVAPLLTRLADRFWFEGETFVVQRGGRSVRIRMTPQYRGELDAAFIPVGPVLAALGATVRYDSTAHRLMVRLPARTVVGSPTPFNPGVPSVAPSAVFTPLPPATPRPIWTGSPMPRRTGLPFPPPNSADGAR
jgi:hypothetical protein